MKFAIVTAFHGRPKISEIFFAGVERLNITHDVMVCAAVTKGDNENIDLCMEHKAFFEVHDNINLAGKFNLACEVAQPHSPDAVIILGSDDLISSEYLDELSELIAEGHQYMVPGSLAFYSTMNGKGYVMDDPLISKTMLRYGAGRVYTRELMDRINWNPWPKGKVFRKGLDTVSHNRVVNIHRYLHITSDTKPHVLDVKSAANMWGMDRLGKKCKQVDKEQVLWFIGEKERSLIAAV